MIENYVIKKKHRSRAYTKMFVEPSDGSLFVYDDDFEDYFTFRFNNLYLSVLNCYRNDESLLNLALNDKGKNIGMWKC